MNSSSNGNGMKDKGDINNEIMNAFEQTMKELQFKIKQQERDISFKDEEVKHYKKIARDLAEKLEQCNAKELELQYVIDKKNQDIDDRDKQIK